MWFSQSGVVMKIYDQNISGTSASPTGRAQEAKKTGRAGGNKPTDTKVDAAGDQVEFSGTLSRLSRTLETFEANRATQVQALAAEFQAGTLKPDSQGTSRGLISEALSAVM
jgi:hypothetical protein